LISLGKFLRSQDGPEVSAYVRALSLLVQGVEVHTFDYNKEDYEHFRASLAEVQRNLRPEIAASDLLVLVGGAVRIIEDYNHRAAARLGSQFQELQSIIATFSGAVATMVTASDASLLRLRGIQSQLSAAEQIGDLRTLKVSLCDCLVGMASEVEQHKKNSAASMSKLAEGARKLEISAESTHGRVVCDPATGLPARAAAEAALSSLVSGGVQAVAVVFVMKRLRELTSRFGPEVGNSLFAWLSAYLRTGANPEKGFYRWTGPALLAVISRNAPLLRIRREIASLVAEMPEREITIGARTVTLPLSVGWTVFPVTSPVEKLVRQLEVFVESQSSEGDSLAAG